MLSAGLWASISVFLMQRTIELELISLTLNAQRSRTPDTFSSLALCGKSQKSVLRTNVTFRYVLCFVGMTTLNTWYHHRGPILDYKKVVFASSPSFSPHLTLLFLQLLPVNSFL